MRSRDNYKVHGAPPVKSLLPINLRAQHYAPASITMPGLSSKTGRKASRRSRRLMDKHSQRSLHRHSQNSPRALRLLFLSELLEMIFLYLDMQTLLLSRRVCHTWDEVIQGSRKLQQALFYFPDTTIPAEPGRHNPLIIDELEGSMICSMYAFCSVAHVDCFLSG
ncbi:hypothetical protein BO99DRAFT_211142 [Aspergillus violaceofuscus CBS 115571]|uniref:F-box domain-containing protein n=1 Tax=Aspergillus violaceofuscus (strain CBS 115571) TaxID=1450538 RepID=A0A2V5GZX7_ASPV1|nr:hypothetical protein BO99DRAFT_211142 [Aspergillus violaceofuscus CBS 115571]